MFNPEKPTIKRRVQWKRLRAFFAPYRREEFLVVACIILIAILGLLPALFTKWLIDDALPHHDLRGVLVNVGGMVVSAILAGLVGVYQGYLNAIVGEGIMRDLRISLVAHLQRMSLSFFTETKTGEIMNRVSNDVDNIDNVLTGTLANIVSNIAVMGTTLVVIFVLDWRLSLISLAIIPLMILPLSPVGRRMYDIRKSTREKRDEIESITQETLSLSGITLIKSFVREDFEKQRFGAVAEQSMQLEISLAMVGRWFMASINAMVVMGPALVWLAGSLLYFHGGVTIGTIVAFITYLARLYTPASTLAGVQVQIVSALAVFERILEYLDMPLEAEESAHPIELSNVAGAVAFENVSFSYDRRPDALSPRKTLRALSFSIEPGQMAAFVGHSGAGKTTITALVPRFYDVDEGRVLIDGHDVRELSLASLRRNVGIVTQETYLFHDTIGRNLRYGRMDASDAQLEAAARAANIHDTIMRLPLGYDTIVGERGHKLSGGERQRLAIARVLLKDPKILILDEATSALDSNNESLIQAALVPLMQGRTSLVIAHRLSTILAADVIFVVDSGRIVEHGRHEELLTRGSVYAQLYNDQFKRTTELRPL